MPLGPPDPKYSIPAFPYRRRYWKKVSCEDTIHSFVVPLLRLDTGWGDWCNNITEYSDCQTDTELVRNNHGPHGRFEWWFRSGVICACDCKVLTGCCSIAALKKSMTHSQLSETSPGAQSSA